MRLGAAPPDRNPVRSYLDTGLSYKGLLAGRPDDVLALGLAHAELRHGSESLLELSYVAPVTPRLSLQPDLQYVVQRGVDIPNAWVAGLRAHLRFWP